MALRISWGRAGVIGTFWAATGVGGELLWCSCSSFILTSGKTCRLLFTAVHAFIAFFKLKKVKFASHLGKYELLGKSPVREQTISVQVDAGGKEGY